MRAGSHSVQVGRADLSVPAALGIDARRSALASLDVVNWPRSSQSDQEWLFVRRIDVAAQEWNIGSEAAQEAYKMDAEASDGWVANNSVNSVRFRSRGALLARLLSDLANGSAQNFWFWETILSQNPVTDKADAICSFLSREPLEIPDTVLSLGEHSKLEDVLSELTDQHVDMIIEAISRETGWPLPNVTLVFEKDQPPTPSSTENIARIIHLDTGLSDLVRRSAAVARFISIISVWTETPHVFASADQGFRHIRDAEAKLVSEPPAVHEIVPDTDGQSITEEIVSSDDVANFTQHLKLHGVADHDVPDLTPVNPNASASENAQSLEQTTQSAPDISDRKSRSEIEDRQSYRGSARKIEPTAQNHNSESRQEGFLTEQAGVFFLLNALNLQKVRDITAFNPAPGFHWMTRIGFSIGFEPDDLIARFLANELKLPSARDVANLGKLHGESRVLEILQHRYAHLGIWNAALLARVGRVRFSVTHIDVDYHLDSVSVDVRRSGLDADPGWLDWLGKVVRFHYVSDPALAGVQ